MDEPKLAEGEIEEAIKMADEWGKHNKDIAVAIENSGLTAEKARAITQHVFNKDVVEEMVNGPVVNWTKRKESRSEKTAKMLAELEQSQGVCSVEKFPDLQWSVFDGSNKDHEGLIFGTWCNHIKSFNEYKRMSRAEFQYQRGVIGKIVERCPPLVLHSNKGEPLFGFICSEYQKVSYGERQVLHFMYVRNMWRRRGFGSLMMKLSFNKWKKDTIFHSFPMRSVPHLADRWILKRKRTAAFYEEK